MDHQRTQIILSPRGAEAGLDDRVHCLEMTGGPDFGRRYVVPVTGLTVGRVPPNDIVFADPQVSRSHCRIALGAGDLIVTDLGSTNGVYVDGARIVDATRVPVGSVVQIGAQSLKHQWRSRREVQHANQLDRDIELANAYVQALLPPRIVEGPIRADWVYQPSAKLGGDAFGYGALSERQFVVYLVDVSGHGAGAAMHSVAVMNALRQRALPGVDMADPAAVLGALNAMFQMEHHAEMYFTIWYGVFDTVTRRMDFASAGHHAAYVRPVGGADLIPLRKKNGIIGARPDKTYTAGSAHMPPGASLYVFSDGVFEIVTNGDVQWGLQDFLPLILRSPVAGLSECHRLYQAVTAVARPGGLDDDFSLVVLTFD